ncbi:MAG: choice-of-anchor tandem repeat GloVer-containing protein [Terriglobales bacterium]|jgi:uncharacterized repeat protein (TIGR03803 family)
MNSATTTSPTKLTAAVSRAALTLTLLSALLLIAARPAQAQTETVLYNFTGGSDGRNPYSRLTSDGAGNFYGTTFNGGVFASGTVFELSPNPNGGWNETVLYSFTGGLDGSNPWFSPVIFDRKGNLYGTTYYGGPGGTGVVFQLSPAEGGWTETVLHGFAGGEDGVNPINGLAMGAAGNLYGTTYQGGQQGDGVVFELSASGGNWTEQVIYEGADTVWGGVTVDPSGNIFGATPSWIFELSPNGNGGWSYEIIKKFNPGGKNGGPADTPVLDQAGNVYGTTVGGYSFGTVFKLSPGNKGKWTKQTLHHFAGGQRGDLPWPSVLIDAAGNVFGTTIQGGKSGDGVVYELSSSSGAGGYKEKVLCSFNGANGAQPWGGLILDSAGNIYGTTDVGGTSNAGTVFEVTP